MRINAHHLSEKLRKIIDDVCKSSTPLERRNLSRKHGNAGVSKLLDGGYLSEYGCARVIIVSPLTRQELEQPKPDYAYKLGMPEVMPRSS